MLRGSSTGPTYFVREYGSRRQPIISIGCYTWTRVKVGVSGVTNKNKLVPPNNKIHWILVISQSDYHLNDNIIDYKPAEQMSQ